MLIDSLLVFRSMSLDSGGENGELEGDSVPNGIDESGLLVEEREGSL